MDKKTEVLMSDGDTIIIKRQFDQKEQARIEIKDALAPRGEQILRTIAVSFPQQWHVLGADSVGDNTIVIQVCS